MTAPKKATLYNLILRLVSKGLTYLFFLALANFFILEEFGAASFAMSGFYIIISFVLLGLPDAYVPFLVKKNKVSEIFYFLLILSIVTSIVASIFLINHRWLLSLIFAAPFVFLLRTNFAILQSKHKHHLVQLLTLGIVLIPLILIFFLRDFAKEGIILSYTGGFIITGILSCFFTSYELSNIIKNTKISKNIFFYVKSAIPIAIIGFSFGILARLDSVILGILGTMDNVARYNIAFPIANIVNILPLSIGMFLLTKTAKEKNKSKQIKIYERTKRISYSASLIGAIIIASVLNPIINIFFPKYSGIGPYTIILLMGIVLSSVYILTYYFLIGKFNSKKALLPLLLATIINIILDITLIPYLDLYGIVIATLIAHSIAFILLVRKNYLALIYIFFIPLSYLLNYFGILIIIILIPFLHYSKLLEKEDILIVTSTIFGRKSLK